MSHREDVVDLKSPCPTLRANHPHGLMTITLPDDPALAAMSEEDIRLDLACGAFAAGHVSRGVAARMAGLERHAFDEVLYTRRIPSFTEEMLDEDLATLRTLGLR